MQQAMSDLRKPHHFTKAQLKWLTGFDTRFLSITQTLFLHHQVNQHFVCFHGPEH